MAGNSASQYNCLSAIMVSRGSFLLVDKFIYDSISFPDRPSWTSHDTAENSSFLKSHFHIHVAFCQISSHEVDSQPHLTVLTRNSSVVFEVGQTTSTWTCGPVVQTVLNKTTSTPILFDQEKSLIRNSVR